MITALCFLTFSILCLLVAAILRSFVAWMFRRGKTHPWLRCAWHPRYHGSELWYSERGSSLPYQPWHVLTQSDGICPGCFNRMQASLNHDVFNAPAPTTATKRSVEAKLRHRVTATPNHLTVSHQINPSINSGQAKEQS